MFEEFLNDPVQNELIKKQLTTNNVTGNIPVTHNVSQIVSDEHGMHVEVNPQHSGEAPVLSPANESKVVLDTTEPDDKTLIAFCKKHNIKMKEVNPNGPGGNFAEYEYSGSRTSLEKMIDKFWDDEYLHTLIESTVINEEVETQLGAVSFFKTKDGEGVVIKELGNRKESVFVSWEDLSKIKK